KETGDIFSPVAKELKFPEGKRICDDVSLDGIEQMPESPILLLLWSRRCPGRDPDRPRHADRKPSPPLKNTLGLETLGIL
ncbi:hypothetical protein AKJ57_03995, partial [candidate division MSBL1 archaeon SCGC-AAA259A05]